MKRAKLTEGFDLVTGKDLQERCDANHITLNKNAISGDPENPSVTSGVRMGTAAEVKATVAGICQKFPMYV